MSKYLYNISYDDYGFSAIVIADSEEDAINTFCNDTWYHDNCNKQELRDMINSIDKISMNNNRIINDTILDV